MRIYLTVFMLLIAGLGVAQDSLGVNARTRPRTRRLAPAYQEGQFIIANSVLNGEWADSVIWDGTYLLLNGDTVLVSPLPPGLSTEWTLAGDAGTPQLITDGNTATIAGGTGITTTAGATDQVTIDWAALLEDLDNVVLTSPTSGQVLEYNGTNWVNATDDTGAGSFTFDLAADSGTPETVDDAETVTITGGTGISSTVSATNTVTLDWAAALGDLSDVTITTPSNGQVLEYNAGTWVNGIDDVDDADADPGNELQTYGHTGTTSYTNTLSDGGGSFTLQATGIATISHSAGTVTIDAVEVDGSTSNELQTYGHTGTTSYTNTLSDGGGSFTLQAGSGVTISHTTGTVTIAATGDGTGMSSWDLAGDSGTPQTIDEAETATIAGGTNISTVAGATNTVTVNWAADIADLTDVNTALASPTLNQILKWDGDSWEYATDETGAGGTMTNWIMAADSGTPETVNDSETATWTGGTNITTSVAATNEITIDWAAALADLSNVVLTSPTSGQVLEYNGTNWVNATDDTGAGADDDWRFSAGTTYQDPAYRDGLTSIFTTAATHGLRVDSTFQFNVEGGLAVLDWQDGSTGKSSLPGLFWEARGNTDGVEVSTVGGQNNIWIGASTTLATGHTIGTYGWGADDPNAPGTYRPAGLIKLVADKTWTGSAHGSIMEFHVSQPNDTALHHGMTIHSSGRIQLPQYGSFSDSNPDYLLGWSNTSEYIQKFDLAGTRGENKVLKYISGAFTWADDLTGTGSWTIDADAGDTEDMGGQTLLVSGTGIASTSYSSATNTLTIDAVEVDGSITNEAWTIDADDVDTEQIADQTVLFAGAGITSTDYDPGTNTLTITSTEVDGSTSNELQTYGHTGTTSYTNTLSDGGGSFTLQATGIATISHSAGTVTIDATEVDGSITNEAWTILADDSGTELVTNQTIDFAGNGIVTTDYSAASNTLTINAVEVDGSVSNELQTYAHTGTTSYTNTLSDGGGSFTLQAGANVTISHSAGTVTISASGGGGSGNIWSPSDRDTTTQASHGFVQDSIPIPVYNDGDGAGPVWVKASNSAVGTLHDAFIVEVIDANTVVTQASGYLEVTGHGFTSQADYFLGASGERKPGSQLGDTEINDWLFHALDNNNLLLKDVRPYIPEGAASGEGSFVDNLFEIVDDIDNTKVLNFQLSGVTTATTRTLTIPDASGTIALTSDIGDASDTNEGSLTVLAGTATTSIIQSNTTGSTDVTLQAGTNITLSEAGNTITIAATGSGGLSNVVEDTTPELGGTLDALGNDIVNLGDVTFQTGATGGTLRTGTSSADKFTLQAYDVDGASYTTLMEADAGNDPYMQIFVDYFRFEDAADATKIAKFDVSGITTGTTRTFSFPDASGTFALTGHAADHESGGADEIDGDILDIDWNPASYTPATTPTEVTTVDQLTAHLYGIDQFLEYLEPDAPFSQTSGTIDLESEKNNSGTINMTGLSSITITLNNPVTGGAYIIRFSNADNTDTVTWPGTVLYEDGTAVGTGILSDGRRMVQLWYDGTNYYIPGGY